MTERLVGKVALVTGGGSGIGEAIALRFAAEGAHVALCGRTAATINAVARDVEARGRQTLAIPCDVSQATAVAEMIRVVVATFGRLDVLVNNAGVRASLTTVEDLTEQEWHRTMDIDAKGSWLCSKYAIPELRRSGGGSILMISSISAHVGQPQQGCYNAAKAAQELLMKCMAIDFAKDRIRVNSICPAWVQTEMNRVQLQEMRDNPNKVYPPGLNYKDVERLHPLGRVGDPADIAGAAVFLASDDASWITGTSLMVDGGYTCQ